MKLVVIYGPPATGKLTVAKELSNLIKFKIFPNHLTIELLNSLFKFGTESYIQFNDKLRLMMFEEASRQKINGIIFTYCYGYPLDHKWIKKLIKTFEGKGI